MDLLQLEYFLAVARHEHVSRAAAELRVAQPSLSRSLARLEHELGAPLFDRVGRTVELNPLGRLLADRGGAALAELADVRREIADATGAEPTGELAIGAETLLPVAPFIADFRERYPAVEFRLLQLDAGEMAARLADRSVDLCFASQPVTGPALVERVLSTERVHAAVSHAHPLASRRRITTAALASEPFVVPRRGHWLRRLFDELYPDDPPRIAAETNEPGAVPYLVAAGIGVTLLPAAGRMADTSGQVHWLDLADPRSTRRFALVRRADRYLTTAMRTFEAAARAARWPGGRARR